jgi:hypothetical protein
MAQELAKAIVRVLDGRRAGDEIEVIFNPTEYSIEYGASFQETSPPGLSNPILQFVNGTAQSLTMELLFDTYTDGGGADVSERTQEFTDMLAIDGDLHAPPRVEFEWGVFAFKAIVEKISERFTMFLSDGTPVRATLSVTFKQYKTVAEQLENPRRNSADKTKRRVFEAHDSLWLMAAREYGQPKYWRLIARENRIEDPRALVPGMVVVLPPLEDFKLQEGEDGP